MVLIRLLCCFFGPLQAVLLLSQKTSIWQSKVEKQSGKAYVNDKFFMKRVLKTEPQQWLLAVGVEEGIRIPGQDDDE